MVVTTDVRSIQRRRGALPLPSRCRQELCVGTPAISKNRLPRRMFPKGFRIFGEVDVHPNWRRKGVGRQLMEALLNDARARKLNGATLTTDRFAPFNAVFYASSGFHAVEGEACVNRRWVPMPTCMINACFSHVDSVISVCRITHRERDQRENRNYEGEIRRRKPYHPQQGSLGALP